MTKIMAAIEEIQNAQLPAQREANVIAVTVKVNAVKPQAPFKTNSVSRKFKLTLKFFAVRID